MLTIFNLMIYLAGFGLTDLFMKEFRISVEMKVIIYILKYHEEIKKHFLLIL